MKAEELTQIGFIKKIFGKKGEVILQLLPAIDFNAIKKFEWIIIDIDSELVPFHIEYYEERTSDSLLLKITDINIDKATKLTGLQTYLTKDCFYKTKRSKTINYKSIIGYKVNDKIYGNIGFVEELISKTEQDLLVINFNKKQILMPVNEDIILKINDEKQYINIAAPDGLIDLYINA